jgi:hypothetical protein
MEKEWLKSCLAKEMSLDAIGQLVGRHPSTVSYWLKKYGLEAVNAELHAPKGPLDRVRLEALASAGLG